MFFKEIFAVYCENRTKSTDSVGKMQRFSVLKRIIHMVTTGLGGGGGELNPGDNYFGIHTQKRR
jgi:hypothetical protein